MSQNAYTAEPAVVKEQDKDAVGESVLRINRKNCTRPMGTVRTERNGETGKDAGDHGSAPKYYHKKAFFLFT